MNKAEISKKYKKLSQLQHLLIRPHMYIGEIYDVEHNNWVLEREPTNTLCIEKDNVKMTTRKPRMENIQLKYNPGILKLFDEIILNACDHSVETKKVTSIKVNVSKDCITIENDGPGIPIIKHTEHKIWLPELIFTHFLTSSNYDDDQTRLKSGLNGLGAKITSAFSKLFIIETESNNTVYRQRYKNNLSDIETASVMPSTKKKGRKVKNDFTRITFYPDFNRLKIKCITPETFRILERRAYDIAAYVSTSSGVFPKVYFNNKEIGVKSFKEYIQLFLSPEQLSETLILKNERWSIAICSNLNEQFSSISFVNGVHTRCDGTHVNYILNQIIKHVFSKLNKEQKNA